MDKKIRNMKRIIFFIGFLLLITPFANAQTGSKQRRLEKEAEVKQLIDSQKFRFVAREAIPLSGSKVNLTSLYDLKVDGMMIESWLPFFGRAYHVDYGSQDGGIKFKEKADHLNIRYKEKKKVYEINITVDTDKDNYKINISAGASGYADMTVVSNNRQSISYYGVIEPLKEEKEN